MTGLICSPPTALERIKRRTRAAGLCYNKVFLSRLVGVILMETNEEWQMGNRYLNVEAENKDPRLTAKHNLQKKRCVTPGM